MDHPTTLPRRDFLESTTGFLTGIIVSGSPLARIAPSPVWAVDLTSFTSSEGSILMAVTRTICPHDRLEDAAYALVVKAIDHEAGKAESLRRTIREGLGQLGPSFAAAPETDRVQALKNVESSEFFQTIRTQTLQVLYSSPIAYAYFGYEGEAFSKGGYLLRGFNDLRWLPEVPLEAGGPMPMNP